ncbi:MAG TPA: TIGR02680 family protein, partial [Actinomycetota bacterium]|nr:TIGR02680 family protein [Actinomycetota bacterium]
MSPSIQPLFRAQPDPDRLPTPTRPRYTLLRIGIQNIWEYDITTRFVARDGRLLLRGQNESGKTKAVEVSLPAVLDAILRAERLDPFGEQARTMRENLIGPHTDEDATVVAGYVWAEFGRLTEQGQPQYQTAGYGVRASRNASGFTSWFFLTGLRPDLDLHLFVDGRPRSQRELDEVLGPQGEVFGGHGDHRAAVNR